MTYASVCDGIGAVHVAWQPLGWECAWTAEIEPFPAAVVDHHYGFPNLGDITEITDDELAAHEPIDLLVGGTPCQSFSVAGLREGLADPRGNLAFTFLGLVDRARPEWVVWENVPGVLSSNEGRDFGAILGALGQLGYGFAYRVLDAQFFGVPQRRRRVFVVGHSRDWRRAAAVLFERESLSGNPAPSAEAWSGVAALTANGVGACGADDNQGQAGHLIPLQEVGAREAKKQNGVGIGIGSSREPMRRLTVEECEALQGFPRGYTAITYRGKPAADGPRYKAIGNSMAVPVMRWIGERIAQ